MPSLFRHPSLIRYVLRHLPIFMLGWREANDSDGCTYDGSAWSARSMAYDTGRDLRRWGQA